MLFVMNVTHIIEKYGNFEADLDLFYKGINKNLFVCANIILATSLSCYLGPFLD